MKNVLESFKEHSKLYQAYKSKKFNGGTPLHDWGDCGVTIVKDDVDESTIITFESNLIKPRRDLVNVRKADRSKSLIATKVDGKRKTDGVLDTAGNEILPFKFVNICEMPNGFFRTTVGIGQYSYYRPDGTLFANEVYFDNIVQDTDNEDAFIFSFADPDEVDIRGNKVLRVNTLVTLARQFQLDEHKFLEENDDRLVNHIFQDWYKDGDEDIKSCNLAYINVYVGKNNKSELTRIARDPYGVEIRLEIERNSNVDTTELGTIFG